MEYMLLIYGDEAAAASMTAEEGERVTAEYMAFTQELIDAGALAGGSALQGTDTATHGSVPERDNDHDRWTVRRDEGGPGRLLHRGMRGPGSSDRVGGEDPRRPYGRGRGAAAHEDPGGRRGLTGDATAVTRTEVEHLVRQESGRVLATLIRMIGDFDLAEESLQEALIVALQRWPVDGVPTSPAGWITTTARNRGTSIGSDVKPNAATSTTTAPSIARGGTSGRRRV